MSNETIKSYWQAFSGSERGRRLMKAGRRLFFAGILGMLVYQLSEVGWRDITTSLPATPWFYLIFLVLYFSLPLSESVVYRQLWRFRYWEGLIAFLKKRVLNKDVLGYSGDVYIYLWARKVVDRSEREIRGAVKDNAIVSSIASTVFAVGVLAGLFLTGHVVWAERLAARELVYAVGGLVVLAILGVLAFRFRRTLFLLPSRVLAVLFGIHVSRLLLTNVLQVVQWSLVLPGTSWTTWGTLLAVQIVVSRISFLPAREWLFMGASVSLAQTMDVSAAGIAGMLLASNVLDKGLNLLFFTLSSLTARRAGRVSEAVEAVPVVVAAGEAR